MAADATPTSVAEVKDALGGVGYLADEPAALVAYLAQRLGKPVLVEGPAGVGKTELAKALSRATGRELIRLQCYEGLDEAKALYEWNYRKQLLRIQAETGDEADERGGVAEDIFGEEFLLTRPLLAGDRLRRAGRAADRRDRQDRPGVRGDAARGALGLPDLDPRARRDRGAHAPDRRPHLEQLARADRGAQAPLPLPVARLPRGRARDGDRAPARARARRDARPPPGRGDPHGPPARPEEAALDRRVDRLGARAAAARRRRHRPRRCSSAR